MKKSARWILISVGVLATLALSAVGALAMAPAGATPTPVISKSPVAKGEVTGTITALEASSLSVDGTAYKIGPGSELPTGLKLGDKVTLEFSTDATGSLTVVEVALAENSEPAETLSPSEAPSGSVEAEDKSESVDSEGNSEGMDTEKSSESLVSGDNSGNQNNQGGQNQIQIMNTSQDFNSSTQSHFTNNLGKKSGHIEGGGSIK